MKNDKNNQTKKISELVIIILVLAGIFGYFKNRWDSKRESIAPMAQLQTDPTPAPAESQTTPEEESIAGEAPATASPETATTPAQKKPDPLLMKISEFATTINERHEQKLRDMFKAENKEEFMDRYLELKREKSMRMHDLLKTDNSRASMVKLNYEFHNKFYEIVGRDLYSKYLKVLKETNDDAKKTKIVLEF